ncbi:plastocyanin/azurin family copper-binding protein [Chengkuizengella axinellae]|uniref:Plastocyanin/azurin family copper-binding protein n=1 Tax=Chengkuizengella axinellae TaxID=3064388 RepID=A0ABT9J7T1_9BACL|nr:plastocyanin/azurin family copper-binding protein [Chengkuizengella sp. 2205SS18-9]MDP5277050.1 plastocyanin/azurin family copper-binding protein [Chengkuizengella sp. 2205SS18-9]
MKKYLVFLGLFIIILAGCSPNDEQSLEKDPSTVQQEQEQQVEQQEQQEQEGLQEVDTNDATVSEKSQEPTEVEKVEDLTIEVSAFEMGYDPDKITLVVGKEYELVLTNDGKIFHDLTESNLEVEITYMSEMADHSDELSFIDQFFGIQTVYADEGHDKKKDDEMNNIHMNANAGQTVSIKFIPKETGEFEFYCTVPGHKEAGMVGEFIVES